jgi:hypothetical protein
MIIDFVLLQMDQIGKDVGWKICKHEFSAMKPVLLDILTSTCDTSSRKDIQRPILQDASISHSLKNLKRMRRILRNWQNCKFTM